MPPLILTNPNERFAESFKRGILEYRANGENQYWTMYSPALEDFDRYLESLKREAAGEGLKVGYVPGSTFWLLDNSTQFLGAIRVRHYLTPALELEGGHIGYDIVPSQRGKGYGKEILRLGLEEARKLALKKALLTCDANNTRSKRVIEANGGKFLDQLTPPTVKHPTMRFWIEIE